MQKPVLERSYRWDNKLQTFVPSQRTERFLKGPVPMAWLAPAAKLPGRALAVAIAILRLSGAVKSATVKLSNAEVEVLGVGRNAKSRALRALQKAGLISIDQRPGCLPRVTILAIAPELGNRFRNGQSAQRQADSDPA